MMGKGTTTIDPLKFVNLRAGDEKRTKQNITPCHIYTLAIVNYKYVRKTRNNIQKYIIAIDQLERNSSRTHAVLQNQLTYHLLRNVTNQLFHINSLSTFVTHPTVKMSVEEEKQNFLKMSLEDKRSHYQINATTIDQIMSWRDYCYKNKTSTKKNSMESIDKVDEALANKVSMWQGDITSLEIDAIVNAANSSLMGGGGVDGAIHSAAGPSLKKECEGLGGCQVGEAKITGGYRLPAKYVIHTVGPQGEKPEKLRNCYENSLALAVKNDLRTIAFPCISTGVYGYPQKPAAKIALTVVKKFLQENQDKIDRIIFCLFLKSDKDIYEEMLQKYFAIE